MFRTSKFENYIIEKFIFLPFFQNKLNIVKRQVFEIVKGYQAKIHLNKLQSFKFLRIYQTNHLNITMNYAVCVENCCKH